MSPMNPLPMMPTLIMVACILCKHVPNDFATGHGRQRPTCISSSVHATLLYLLTSMPRIGPSPLRSSLLCECLERQHGRQRFFNMSNSIPQEDTRGKWLALTAALLGWMFDGLEMGLFPLVGTSRPPGPDRHTDEARRPVVAWRPPASWSAPPPAACCSAGSATASAGSGP